ncbi:conserved hypothetical plastid protein (plastid) [Chondrus crispus]|uniref:Uncharacterized protein ycf35 n=1 Tax=Chondrus crispus TaxID=2769 RepID=M5DEQ7_CHOCR|nr:conserved hypothetical plastid protein [Chondrus crispus]CCP38061.1 conserved hypothetical plastid protein [Chondrus crispus]|eukprot:YP_007627314.1 conserved hypothetical plastid protein (plastid) [Chondrus crispus]
MSHLSRIKTCINNEFILKQTLIELGFNYENNKHKKQEKSKINTQLFDLIITINNKDLCEFIWDGYEYSFVADFQLWNYNIPYEQFLEKIKQKYSYNVIIQESIKQGFINITNERLQDGSIKLIIQRWNE